MLTFSTALVLMLTLPLAARPSFLFVLSLNILFAGFWTYTLYRLRNALICLCLLGGCFFAMLLFFNETWQALLVTSGDFIEWLVRSTKMMETFNPLYSDIVVALICFGLSLFVCFFVYKRALASPLVIFSIASAVVIHTSGYAIDPVFVYTLFAAVSYLVLRKIRLRRSDENTGPGHLRFLLTAGGLVALSLLVTAAGASTRMQASSDFWKETYNKAYYAIKEPLLNISEFASHSLDKLGYGERNEELGGEYREKDRDVLKVQTDLTDRPLYLAGTVYGRYGSNRWYYPAQPTQKLSESETLRAENREALYLAGRGASELLLPAISGRLQPRWSLCVFAQKPFIRRRASGIFRWIRRRHPPSISHRWAPPARSITGAKALPIPSGTWISSKTPRPVGFWISRTPICTGITARPLTAC